MLLSYYFYLRLVLDKLLQHFPTYLISFKLYLLVFLAIITLKMTMLYLLLSLRLNLIKNLFK